MRHIRKMEFGPWHVNVCDEAVTVTQTQADEIARFLTERYLPVAMRLYQQDYPVQTWSMSRLGVPCPVVRLDMPPMNGHWPGLYEVEANPAAFGIADRMGLGLTEKIAEALIRLGISRLGYGVAPSRAAQAIDLQIFMEALALHGVETLPIDLQQELDNDLPLWLRAGHEDLDQVASLLERCLLCHYHGGGHKRYLYEVDEALTLASFSDPITGPFERFPEGFAVKPDGGWGTMVLHTWCPSKPWKDKALSRRRMERDLADIVARGQAAHHMVQRFGPPGHSDGNFRIWRLNALWNGQQFRPIGGCWAERRSLMIHGASDCVMGPLLVE